MKLGLLARETFLGALELGDVGDRGHRAVRRDAATDHPVDLPVRCVVLEGLARGIAKAFDPPGDQRTDVALAVIAVLGQEAEHVGIRASTLQELPWDRVHLGETVVAEDEVLLLIGENQRAGHVVERDLQLGLLLRHLLLGPFAGSDVGIGEHQSIVGDRGVSDIEDLSGRQRVFELVRPARANAG